LIVDDEAEIRTLIAEILTRDGFEIQEAGSAEEAFQILDDFAPNLLLTDYSLPDANGSALIEKAKSVFPNIKCLMITGWSELPNPLEGQTQADVIVTKPFRINMVETEALRLLADRLESPNPVSSVAQEAC
jgi:DNA-binding NtrC family response regulator